MTNFAISLNDASTTLSGLNSGDTLSFENGFNFENFSFLQEDDDLLIYTDNGTTIRLENQLLTTTPLVHSLSFANGETINLNVSNFQIGTSHDQSGFGTTADDNIFAGTGNNNISGGIGNDVIYAGAGDDTIYGSAGNDFLYGNAGRDTFIFNNINDYSGSARNVIKGGFDSNDIIDISDLIEFDGTGPLSDFVVLTDNGTNTTISVDTDGGVNNFTQVAIIQNTTGQWTDADDMVAQAN